MSTVFENKYAIVTGGSRGIGASIVLLLAERGAKGIAITYFDNEVVAKDAVAKVKAHGADAVAILHLLPILHTTNNNFDSLFRAKVRAPLYITRAVLPYMPAKGGRIINVSSVTAKQAADEPGILYGASKAALNSITRSMAGALAAEKSLTINSISIGPIKTPAMEDALANLPKEYMEGLKNYATAEKRLAEPEEIAAIVAFVASDEARWMNGASVPANGGAILLAEG
ncbi:hypothetical protein ACQKWADRAFT_320797 [Trichoderma austrokoningii]